MRITSLVLTIALIALLFCGCSSAAPASDFEYHKDVNRIVIDKYIGSDKEVVIPEKINSLPIEVIAKEAFKNTNITSVTIPDSVLYINEKAFYECKKLEEVNFGNGITFIGQSAFSNCTSLKKIILPKKVQKIETAAFYGCTSATEIFVPKSLKKLEMSVFGDCRSLTVLTLEDGVEKISSRVFFNAQSLKSVVIPESVTSIYQDAFSGCRSMEEATFLGDCPKTDLYDISNLFSGMSGKYDVVIYFDPNKNGWDNPNFNSDALKPIS